MIELILVTIYLSIYIYIYINEVNVDTTIFHINTTQYLKKKNILIEKTIFKT